jgi:acyl carrier protein
MPDKEATPEALRALLLEHLHVEVPSVDADLLESGVLDSLQLVDLLLVIEQRFGRRIPIESIDLDNLRSLSRLAQLVGASVRAGTGRAETAPESPPGLQARGGVRHRV